MPNKLIELQKYTTVVADTGEISAIKQYRPEDATTNPSLILKAAQLDAYSDLVEQSVLYAKKKTPDKATQLIDASDKLAVSIGKEILDIIPGKISTEVDARLSYNTEASIEKARKLIDMYQEIGVKKNRILIKLAATWQGIRAAETLEKEGIHCNLTLLFSFAQAQACAEAGVYLISPFVGRIMDWYKNKEQREFTAEEDPGVQSVTRIYQYYKTHNYNTIVMGASFRNTSEILALAGCDKLTISPKLLAELEDSQGSIERKLNPMVTAGNKPTPLSHDAFLWQHNQDPMAVEKLAEGIRNFAADQVKLEELLMTKF